METTHYSRKCPHCSFVFAAVCERGVCPACGQYSQIDREGNPLALVATEPTRDGDDAALIKCFLEEGGGRVYEGKQFGNWPRMDIIHQQLLHRFQTLMESVAKINQDAELEEIHAPFGHPDWAKTCFADALHLVVLTWTYEGGRADLVCACGVDGGSIDLLVPETLYHRWDPQPPPDF